MELKDLTRKEEEITGLVYHHSVTSGDKPMQECLDELNEIHKKNFPGNPYGNEENPYIQYHAVIHPDGTLVFTRDIDVVGWHCGAMNEVTIGILLIGNFMVDKPTNAQYNSLRAVRRFFKTNLCALQDYKHSDVKATLCPGTNFDINMVTDRWLNIGDELEDDLMIGSGYMGGDNTMKESEIRIMFQTLIQDYMKSRVRVDSLHNLYEEHQERFEVDNDGGDGGDGDIENTGNIA